MQHFPKPGQSREFRWAAAAGAMLALLIGCPARAQDSQSVPCLTSVVLRTCPDRQLTPFQTEADRSDTAQRQQMQDQFASTEQQNQRRAATADDELERIIVYRHQQAPAKPALAEFGQTVAKSGPKDCRNAYTMSGARGRFGVYDLLHDTFTGKPCSWQ